MELSPHTNIDLKPSTSKESRRFVDKDLLMASISDLAATLNDDDDNENKQKNEPFNNLMSSLRSFVDGDDFPEDFLDEWYDSITSCDLDDEFDLNSVKELLASVNELLRSKTTFTLNEGTSLESEMMRLKQFSRAAKREKCQESFDHLSLVDKKPKKPSPEEVRKQKERLASVLKHALDENEEDCCKAPKIKSQRKLKSLNPYRFESASKCDSVPASPTNEHIHTFISYQRSNSAPLSPLGNDPASPVRRWDSERLSAVKRSDSAPKTPMQRPESPFIQPRLPGGPEEHDTAPKKPVRVQSRSPVRVQSRSLLANLRPSSSSRW
jgi:hypothetical protein